MHFNLGGYERVGESGRVVEGQYDQNMFKVFKDII